MNTLARPVLRLLVVFVLLASWQLHAQQPVTYDRILRAAAEPHNWLTYGGTYSSQRYSLLNQITPANVAHIESKWVLQDQVFGAWQSNPLIVDGIMYVTQRPNDVMAVDAKTGRVFWLYRHTPAQDARVCCGANNRGVAILGDTLFMGTLDARLIAIDAKTGKEAWRFYTIPGPGEPGHETWKGDAWRYGSASVWVTGSYDPELNLTYWGIGNPGPDWNPDQRPGDNLYTDSVIALDADTGRLTWHFQFTPNDAYDYDSVQVPVLVDMDWQGKPRKVMLWANRNGYFYALDARTGTLLWKASLGGQIVMAPVTYMVDGKQYVSVIAGHTLVTFALRD
jgi:alcohol dehydrogenase (cytochrome c)